MERPKIIRTLTDFEYHYSQRTPLAQMLKTIVWTEDEKLQASFIRFLTENLDPTNPDETLPLKQYKEMVEFMKVSTNVALAYSNKKYRIPLLRSIENARTFIDTLKK